MILIVAGPDDDPALWLHQRLSAAVAIGVTLITPIQLFCARGLEHRMTSRGSSSMFSLVSGASIVSDQLTAIVNRIAAVPTDQLKLAGSADQDYAAQELHAFILGWLASAECPVLNRPTPMSLVGGWYSQSEIPHLAAQCGLTLASTVVAGSVRSYFVLNGRLIGPVLPNAVRDRLLQLARLFGSALVQIDLAAGAFGPELVRIESFVDYRLGGNLLVRAIARELLL